MNKITRTIKKGLIFLSCLIITCMTWWVTSSPAYAAMEISVDGGDWVLGTLGPTAEQTSDQWTVTGSSDGTIDISVNVSDAHATPWTAGGADNDAGTYGLKTNVGTIIPITGDDAQWMDDAEEGPHDFGLWFLSPSSQSEAQQGQHTLTVTLTASGYYDPLTWLGLEEHTGTQCRALGGTVYTETGNGTICQYPGSNVEVPPGWNQAADWQRYSADWGGDMCQRWKSSGPSDFADEPAIIRSEGEFDFRHTGSTCGHYTTRWHSYGGAGAHDIHDINSAAASPGASPSTKRDLIGIY